MFSVFTPSILSENTFIDSPNVSKPSPSSSNEEDFLLNRPKLKKSANPFRSFALVKVRIVLAIASAPAAISGLNALQPSMNPPSLSINSLRFSPMMIMDSVVAIPIPPINPPTNLPRPSPIA